MTSEFSLPPPSRWCQFKRFCRERHVGKLFEEWHPQLAGAVIGVAVFVFACGSGTYAAVNAKVLPTAVSVASILAGFQATMHAILLSMRTSRIVKSLERTGHYARLVSYIGTGVKALLLFVVIAMLSLVCDAAQWRFGLWPPGDAPSASCPTLAHDGLIARLTTAVLLGLFAFAILSSVRVIVLTTKLLRADGTGGSA